MRINCPICGERDIEEFTYLGDASFAYPSLDESREAWFEAVYQRENPAGEHLEYWQHSAGCRSILRVTRNTITHEISHVELVGPFAEGAEAS